MEVRILFGDDLSSLINIQNDFLTEINDKFSDSINQNYFLNEINNIKKLEEGYEDYLNNKNSVESLFSELRSLVW